MGIPSKVNKRAYSYLLTAFKCRDISIPLQHCLYLVVVGAIRDRLNYDREVKVGCNVVLKILPYVACLLENKPANVGCPPPITGYPISCLSVKRDTANTMSSTSQLRLPMTVCKPVSADLEAPNLG